MIIQFCKNYADPETIGDFTVTSFAVSRIRHWLAGDHSCLVYINFAHTQDYYAVFVWGYTACFSLLSSKKMENEENSG